MSIAGNGREAEELQKRKLGSSGLEVSALADHTDRILITVATLVALYRTNELPFHLEKALENGIGRDELVEL